MVGVGAEAFYAEMGDLILPTMHKLEDTLQFAGEDYCSLV